MIVEFANLAAQIAEVRHEVDRVLDDILSTGSFILGPNVKSLEQEIAHLEGTKYGVALNSGTDALILSLSALGIGHGDEVITTPFTFVANIEAICLLGATPIFADIDPDTYNLDPKRVVEKITSRTKAIIPVHLFGQLADMYEFEKIAKAHNLALVGDGAQAIEATLYGKPMGTFGDVATLSFYPTKNLGGAGDGGMVLTSNEEVAENLKLLRFHGSGGGYTYKKIGYCSRLDEIQAAILRIKLNKLHKWNEARRQNAVIYDQAFSGIAGKVATPYVMPGNRHVYHVYTLRIKTGEKTRDSLKAYLAEHQIASSVFYKGALHLQDAYRFLGHKTGDFPVTEQATREVLSLPIHSHLSPEQVEFVASKVCNFFHPN